MSYNLFNYVQCEGVHKAAEAGSAVTAYAPAAAALIVGLLTLAASWLAMRQSETNVLRQIQHERETAWKAEIINLSSCFCAYLTEQRWAEKEKQKHSTAPRSTSINSKARELSITSDELRERQYTATQKCEEIGGRLVEITVRLNLSLEGSTNKKQLMELIKKSAEDNYIDRSMEEFGEWLKKVQAATLKAMTTPPEFNEKENIDT